jgi:hypothetical protein
VDLRHFYAGRVLEKVKKGTLIANHPLLLTQTDNPLMENTGNTPQEVSRRAFIKGTALSAAGFMIVPRHVLGGPGFTAPSDKVNIGVVGVGGRGKENTGDLLKLPDVQVVAIADPAEYWDLNRFYYKTEAGRGPVKKMIESHYQAKTPKFKLAEYVDFRTMLEKERNLDAVLCATPTIRTPLYRCRPCGPASTCTAKSRSRTTSGKPAKWRG